MSVSLTAPAAATRSFTPKPLTEKPSRACASTLSPSVTATSRMLSPNRAIRSWWASYQPTAARAHDPSRAATAGSCQCPTTVLRLRRRRVWMNANSRSPCADWFRFMKSMSIDDHGRSRLNCVWRWTSGVRRSVSPAIHILAGENVCIHAMTPTQAGLPSASRSSAAIPSAVLTTGLGTTRTGIAAWPSRPLAIARACSFTRSRTSGPYRCWLPVTNHSSRPGMRGFIGRWPPGALLDGVGPDRWPEFPAGRRYTSMQEIACAHPFA